MTYKRKKLVLNIIAITLIIFNPFVITYIYNHIWGHKYGYFNSSNKTYSDWFIVYSCALCISTSMYRVITKSEFKRLKTKEEQYKFLKDTGKREVDFENNILGLDVDCIFITILLALMTGMIYIIYSKCGI